MNVQSYQKHVPIPLGIYYSQESTCDEGMRRFPAFSSETWCSENSLRFFWTSPKLPRLAFLTRATSFFTDALVGAATPSARVGFEIFALLPPSITLLYFPDCLMITTIDTKKINNQKYNFSPVRKVMTVLQRNSHFIIHIHSVQLPFHLSYE